MQSIAYFTLLVGNIRLRRKLNKHQNSFKASVESVETQNRQSVRKDLRDAHTELSALYKEQSALLIEEQKTSLGLKHRIVDMISRNQQTFKDFDQYLRDRGLKIFAPEQKVSVVTNLTNRSISKLLR